MTQTNTGAGTKSAGAPKAASPQAIDAMVDNGTAQAKASFDKMSAATTEASGVLKDAGTTAAQGIKDSHAKAIEFARANSNAAFDFAKALLAVKSPSEFIQLSADQARKQFDVLSAQAKELTEHSQKVMRETAEPLKAGAAKAFGGGRG